MRGLNYLYNWARRVTLHGDLTLAVARDDEGVQFMG